MDEMDQILKEFLVEAFDTLDGLDQELVKLEQQPNDQEIINSIFRKVHTIKGTCGFLEFHKLESVTHVGETLLDGVRAGKIALDQDVTSALLGLIDATRQILGVISTEGNEGEGDYSALVKTLRDLSDRRKGEVSVDAAPAPKVVPYDQIPDHLKEFVTAPATVETPKEPTVMEVTPQQLPEAVAQISEDPKSSAVHDTSLRVDVGLLDQLMNLVGELVLARNQILQFTKGFNDSHVLGASQRLNLITSELQEGVMKTRMQPIGNIWTKFPRIVRDLSKSCGKQVALVMVGKETDLDKTIIEAIKDPLTHIVRNSIDHGIETPEKRTKAGKNPEGTITLRAFHEGGHVIIEISDDGGGLNTERIKQKVIEKGLSTAEKLSRMSEQDIHRLIFAPGFSTAEQITNISGRGVGMDVVRSNIENIGGQVDILSRSGEGSTIKIKIPLTLAIIPALLVSHAKERFAIPQVNLVELVRVQGEAIANHIENVGGTKFYRLRGNLLPLVSLGDQLHLESEEQGDVSEQKINIIVVRADERQFGLVVDHVHDTEEIVVKPLGKQLKDVSVFAGATIMGDGKVALILDVPGIARRAAVLSTNSEGRPARKGEAVTEGDGRVTGEHTSLLVVQAASGVRAAIPLELVQRLEEFPTNSLERAGGRPVVQYRDGILPLVDLREFFNHDAVLSDEELQHVVVFNYGSRQVGFIVQKILDIVQERLVVSSEERRTGTRGAAVIQKLVTEVLDPADIVKRSRPEFEMLSGGNPEAVN